MGNLPSARTPTLDEMRGDFVDFDANLSAFSQISVQSAQVLHAMF
jgi:hypothetical protein